MLEIARSHFHSSMTTYPWVASLANILPLSALVDFLDVPRTLHISQLSSSIPYWCWSITPSGSRFLLSDTLTLEQCCLDEYGRTPSLLCLDGRYGDFYPAASPETLRMCLDTLTPINIENTHENMARNDIRRHTLDIIRVSRQRNINIRPPFRLSALSALGWLLLAALLVLCILMHCWWALAFLAAIPLTGITISHVQATGPRWLRLENGSEYNRLVVAAQHMNEMHWLVFYGESSTINSLLNWPLRMEPNATTAGRRTRLWLRPLLRLLILCQWILAIIAAALSGWDAYIVSFWVLVCVFAQTTLFSARQTVPDWMGRYAQISMTKYRTQLSSRRALLNTVIALNPDTMSEEVGCGGHLRWNLDHDGLAWIDPILKAGVERTQWLEATQLAMEAWEERKSLNKWDKMYERDNGTRKYRQHRVTFIVEGIQVCARIQEVASLTGRLVKKTLATSSGTSLGV